MELGIFVAPQVGAAYDDVLRAALQAEQCGFEAFVRSDHYMAAPGQTALPGPTDAWVTLAGLARETTRIRLGTLVSPVTFRLPGPLAIMVAQVDAMSGGRISLGLGASWYEAEHRAYGIPFPPAADRFEQLEEQLAIVRGIWTTPDGELFEFDGKWYQLASCPALPKPVQKPAPPIVVGGRGLRRTPHIAALFADELNVSPASSPQQAKEMFEHADEACNTVGRDPRTLRRTVMVTVVCGEHRADIDRRLAHPGAAQTDVCGTPAQVGDALRAHEEAGSEMAYLRLVDLHDVDHIALIGDALVDELR